MTMGDTAGPSPIHPEISTPLPSVGIFWSVPEGDRTVLVTDRTVLAEAEVYGDCLTHLRGHHEVWEAWRRHGATALRRRGLPPAIAGHEYEAFPRGRVVYMRGPALFTLYADRRLQRPETIAELVRLLVLPESATWCARTRTTAPSPETEVPQYGRQLDRHRGAPG